MQSGGRSGSFQNLVLKGHAFRVVFLKPFSAASSLAKTLR